MLRTLLVVMVAVASASAGAQVLNIGNASVTEGGVATFVVTLSPTSLVPVTVQYATSDGSAVSSGTGLGQPDYVADSGVLLFGPSVGLQVVPITTLDDSVDESTESFAVELSSPSGASLGDAVGSGSISDDDTAEASISDAMAEEGGDVGFDVTLSVPSVSAVILSYETFDGSAVSSGTGLGEPDYVADSGIVFFSSGVTSQPVAISTVDDGDVEEAETFTVGLSPFGGASIADGTGIGTIHDDDLPPQVPLLPWWALAGTFAGLLAAARVTTPQLTRGG